jgi:hypothetical protein
VTEVGVEHWTTLLPELALVGGAVLVNGSPAPDGTQVVTVMAHATHGLCWNAPVTTSEGSFTDVIDPPQQSSGWFPVRFFVNGEEAHADPMLDIVAYSPGAYFSLTLSVVDE